MDLEHVPVVDQHAHNLPDDAQVRTRFVQAFTESGDPDFVDRHARTSLFFRRSIRDISELLECDPVEESILAKREDLGLEALSRLCLDRAGLEAILFDDGLQSTGCRSIEWHARFAETRRILRLETLAQDLFRTENRFDDFLDRFLASLDPLPSNVVALKSIAAYRSGLAVESVSRTEASARFRALKSDAEVGVFRLTDKALVDFLLLGALGIAAKYMIPVQLHTGFGDTDLDLRLANPLHLRRLLEDPKFRAVPLVLLHASYPYVREAAYLASVYPNVYLDCGLAIPSLSISGMRHVFQQLLELAPSSKVLYSSDAHGIPELFYLGAKWGREALGSVLTGSIKDGDLRADEADEIADAILRSNARRLYGLLDGVRGPVLKQ
jgi:predicted TIM-barrel fold metal-dependent hydrolase